MNSNTTFYSRKSRIQTYPLKISTSVRNVAYTPRSLCVMHLNSSLVPLPSISSCFFLSSHQLEKENKYCFCFASHCFPITMTTTHTHLLVCAYLYSSLQIKNMRQEQKSKTIRKWDASTFSTRLTVGNLIFHLNFRPLSLFSIDILV